MKDTDRGKERATFYEQYWEKKLVGDSPHQRWKIRTLAQIIERLNPRSILDVGAGDGALLSRVSSTKIQRVGVELADDALMKMNSLGIPGIKVDLEDGHLPFEDGKFDVVMCLDVLEHVFSPATLLSEIVRVTSPSGRVIISVPNAFNLANRLAYSLGQHLDIMDVAHRTGAMFSEHIRFFSESLLIQMLRANGLSPLERRYYFPDEFTDSRFRFAGWGAKLITLPRLHERIPTLFSLAFLVVSNK